MTIAYFKSRIRQPLIALSIFVVLGVSQACLQNVTSGATALVELPPTYLGLSVNPKIVRNFLGIRVLAADLLWIDTLIKADISKEPLPFSAFYKAFDTITDLDPDHLFGYYVAGIYLSVIKDDFQGATAILKKGVDYMQGISKEYPDILYSPAAWKVPFILGYNQVFEQQQFDEGGKWIRYAATMPEAPKYVKDLAQMASTEYGRLELGARVLSDLRRRLTRPDEIKAVNEKMLKVALKQELLVINDRFQKFMEGTGVRQPSDVKSAHRLFMLFLKQNGHSGKDLLGRPFSIDASGKVLSP